MPTTRDYLYYLDLEDPATAERRRIFLIPAGSAPIATEGPYPDFGEDASPAGGWKRMPSGSVDFGETGEAGFAPDGLPIGVPETATMKLTVHLHECATLSGLADAISDYQRDVTFAGPSTATYTATAANVWTITSDGGDRSLGWEQFTVIFQGVQRILPEKPGRMVPGRFFSQELELFEVSRALLEGVTMKMVCAETLARFSLGGPTVDRTYDLVYVDADGMTVVLDNDQLAESAEMFVLQDLFDTMRALVEAFYGRLLRGAFGWVEDDATVYFFRTMADGALVGHPYSHIGFFRQAYTDDMARGDELGDAELRFIGAIYTDDPLPVRVGGLLVEQSDDTDTLATDDTCFETLRKMCEGSFCRCTFYQGDIHGIALYFHGVLQSALAADEIRLSDVVMESFMEEEGFEVVESGNAIANAKISMRTTSGRDNAERESTAFGLKIEKAFQAELSLHNLPNAGDDGDGLRYGSSPFSDALTFRRILYPWFNLFYNDTPLGIDSAVPIRVHHNAEIRHDASHVTTTGHTSPIMLPTALDMWRVDPLRIQPEKSIEPLLACLYTVQNEGGLTNGVAKSCTDLFSARQMTRYALTMLTSKASYRDVARTYRLMPLDANGNHSAQALQDNDDVPVSHLFGSCQLLHIKPYVGFAGTSEDSPCVPISECTLLGVGY